jgi:phospholipid-binding lipoprotein MlaA
MSDTFSKYPVFGREPMALIVLLMIGCAAPMPRSDDRYEALNRKMYVFNDYADRVAVRPVAQAYRTVTTQAMRRMLSNFFANLEIPITIGNELLQARPKDALLGTCRLVINTTVGILGFFDPASKIGIQVDETDFGITLAKWGVPDGPYLVLPLYGSTTVRDVWNLPIDTYFFDPLYYYSSSHHFILEAQYLPTALYLVTLRSSAIDAEALVEDAYDPYILYRDAYRQRRIYKIYRGNPPPEVIQALQGDNVIDTDELLEEQHQYEQKQKSKDEKKASDAGGNF